MIIEQIGVFSINYSYNNVNCYIAYCLLTPDDKKLNKYKYKYALIRMLFYKAEHFDEYIDCPANSNGISVRYGELRQFLKWYN